MAASVSYHINGKFDNKAINQAQKAMETLSSTAKKTTAAFKALVGVKIFGAISKELSGATEEFRKNNKAQAELFNSLKNNIKVTRSDLRGLVDEFDKMGGFFEGDEVVRSANVLSNFGLSEKQMKDTIKVAQDLAASGLMPLEQAARLLGQSYSGNITQLKKLNPELAELSKDALQSGEAVKILGEKFAGFKDSMNNSFEGSDRNWNSTMGNLKQTIGEIKDSITVISRVRLTPIIDSINNFLVENKDKIINLLSSIPELARIAFTSVKRIWERTFSGDIYKQIGENIAGAIIEAVQFALDTISGLFISVFEVVGSTAGRNFFRNMLASAIDFFISPLQNTIADMLMSNPITRSKGIELANWSPTDKFEASSDADTAAMKKTLSLTFNKYSDEVKTGLKDLGKTFKAVAGDTADKYKDIVSDAKSEISDVMNKDVDATLKLAREASGIGANVQQIATDEDEKAIITGSSDTNDMSLLSNVFSQFGDLGVMLQSFISSTGWIGMLIQLIGEGVSLMKEQSGAFNYLTEIFTHVAAVLNNPALVRFFDETAPQVIEIIMNLAKAISDIAYVIIEILTPIIKGIGYVLEFISKIFETVGAVIYNIWEGLKAFFNWSYKAQYKDIAGIWDADSWSSSKDYSSYAASSGASSGTAASYNAARDIYVTINYNNSFVNGDAQAIAIQLHNEIQNAERLGYIS